jgi:uncharacterized membrane protein YhfC
MVSGLTIVFSVVTLLLSLFFPIVLAVWFCRKYKAPATTVLLGALTFLIFQLVLRLPLLQILQPFYPGKNPDLQGWNLVKYSFFLSFTAALFEEGGRVLICSLFLKRKKNWPHAVALGIGHGGFEAMSLVGLTYISNLVMMALINLGLLDAVNDPTGALSQTVVLLTETPSIMFLLAGIERVLAMILHIGFSVLVVYGLASRNYRYVFYAFSAHFILNFPLAFVQGVTGGSYIAIAYVAVMALLSLYWIIKISPALFQGLQLDEAQLQSDNEDKDR